MSTPPSCRIARDGRITTCVAVGPGLVWYIPEPLRFVPASAVRFREPVHLAAGETMWMVVSWPPTAVGVYAADGRQRAEYRLDADGTLIAHTGGAPVELAERIHEIIVGALTDTLEILYTIGEPVDEKRLRGIDLTNLAHAVIDELIDLAGTSKLLRGIHEYRRPHV